MKPNIFVKTLGVVLLLTVACIWATIPLEAGIPSRPNMSVTQNGFSFDSYADAENMALRTINEHYIILSHSTVYDGTAEDPGMGTRYDVTVRAQVRYRFLSH